MRLLVVAAYRDVDPTLSPRLAALQSELAGERAVSRLRLRGLSADAVAEYVAVAAEEVSSAQLALRLHAETEGNPLFVGETVRLLAIEGVTDAENIGFRIPESVRDVIARRLRHLPRECVEVLETAAILGREFDLAVLAEAVSAPPERLLELLDEAVAARVVAEVDGARGRVRFAHVLIRDTLIDGLSLARRAQLQLAVFAALERLFGDGDAGHAHELAEHALSAGAAPKSLEYARQAVGHARSLHLHDEAARLLRLALEALAIARPTDARGRCALLLELGEAETRAGAAASARSTFVAAADLARVHALDVELALAAAGYGGGVVWGRAGGDPRLVPLLEEGLAAIGDEHLELRVQLLSRLAGALRDEPSRARRAELSEEAVRLARGSGVPALLSYALGGRGHAIAGPDTLDECLALGAELVELGRRSGSLERVVAAHSLRIVAHTAKGDLASAVRELDVSTALAEEIRHAVSLWDVTSTRVLLDLARGDLDRAEEGRERARAIGERALPEAAPAIDTMQRVALADLRGGLAHVEPGLRAVAQATPERPVFRAALAYTHARLGRREEAMRALDALSGGSFSAVPFDQEWLFAMSFLAEAAVLTGHGCSEELYAALAPWEELAAADVGEGFRGSLARYRGLVAAAAGRNADAHRLFERALAANERMGARPWVAHTLSDQGRLLIEQGEPERGRALLGRALETYEVLGMTAHAEAVSASAF